MPVDVIMGSSPLIISVPHASTEVARAVMHRLNETGRTLKDTDWHIDRLHSGLVEDATTVRANFHRYVCDPNCDPFNSTRDGFNVAALVPMLNLDGEGIWDHPPDKMEMASWRSAFHAPYHAALAAQIARVRAKHGFAVLYDCRATRSKVPNQFEGTAPDFCISTHMGAACDHKLAAHVAGICMGAENYTSVINKRAASGWTVRNYGRPKFGVHALEIKLSLSTYLVEESDPWLYDGEKADAVRKVLGKVLSHLQSWHPDNGK